MRRTAIAIVCVAVVIVIGASYFYFHHTGPIQAPAMGTAPSLISLLPPQAPFVVYADVGALRKSAFLAQLIALVPAPAEDPEYSEFVRATGFDYTRDLDRVGIAVLPTNPQPTVWALAEGHFDQQRIAEYAAHAGKTEQRNGRATYNIPSSQGGQVALSFLSPSRIELINSPSGVSPVDFLKPNDDVNGPAMKERISNVAGSAVFAVTHLDAVPKDAIMGILNMGQVASFLQNVQWLSLSAVPDGQDLKVVIEGKCDSSIHAANLQLALQGFKLMGRAMLSQSSVRKQFTPQGAAALSTLVGKIEIARGDQSVTLSAALTPKLLAGLAAPPAQPKAPPAKTSVSPGKAND